MWFWLVVCAIISMKGSGHRYSVSVSQSLVTISPALRLLRLLNPKNRPSIPLDDLVLATQKHLLLLVPSTSRAQVRTTLQAFILAHQTFKITPDQFLECIAQVPTVQSAQPFRRSVDIRPQKELDLDQPTALPDALKRKIRALSQEREFISYDGSLALGRASVDLQRREESFTVPPRRRTASRISHSTVKSKDRKSPESHFRTNDTSFVASLSTTPKRSLPKPVIPSLKDGMEKLLEVRQRYREVCDKEDW